MQHEWYRVAKDCMIQTNAWAVQYQRGNGSPPAAATFRRVLRRRILMHPMFPSLRHDANQLRAAGFPVPEAQFSVRNIAGRKEIIVLRLDNVI